MFLYGGEKRLTRGEHRSADPRLALRPKLFGAATACAIEPSAVGCGLISMGRQLYLSGMPTAATQSRFPRCDLQIVCFPETLQNRGGVRLRGAQVLYMAIASNDRRDREWSEAWPRIKNSLWHGDVVVIHCLAGKHRAATLGAMLIALLQRCSLDAAMGTIRSRRYVEIDKALRDRSLANWVHRTLRATGTCQPISKKSQGRNYATTSGRSNKTRLKTVPFRKAEAPEVPGPWAPASVASTMPRNCAPWRSPEPLHGCS